MRKVYEKIFSVDHLVFLSLKFSHVFKTLYDKKEREKIKYQINYNLCNVKGEKSSDEIQLGLKKEIMGNEKKSKFNAFSIAPDVFS